MLYSPLLMLCNWEICNECLHICSLQNMLSAHCVSGPLLSAGDTIIHFLKTKMFALIEVAVFSSPILYPLKSTSPHPLGQNCPSKGREQTAIAKPMPMSAIRGICHCVQCLLDCDNATVSVRMTSIANKRKLNQNWPYKVTTYKWIPLKFSVKAGFRANLSRQLIKSLVSFLLFCFSGLSIILCYNGSMFHINTPYLSE